MPPKTKRAAKPKSKPKPNSTVKNGGGNESKAGKSGRVLRKNPKKKVISEAEVVEKPVKQSGKPKGRPKKAVETAVKDQEIEPELELSPRDSEDDFHTETGEEDLNENSSGNAMADTSSDAGGSSKASLADDDESDMAGKINKHVDAALEKYFRKRKSKKKGKHKRRRRDSTPTSESSSSDEGSSGDTSDSSPESENSEDERKSRKRKRRSGRKDERKKKRGENAIIYPNNSGSVSTVYTRGCKSPQNAIIEGSGNSGLDGGDIPSDANTDEFIDSLNTSRDRSFSTPDLVRRRDGSRSPERRRSEGVRRGPDSRVKDKEADRYREQADSVIRDLHQNKADLAKPSGELSQFLMSSLVRDFKHFHLTSHVDKKLRERVKEQDFTVDFRRLLPRSRAKARYDERMQVMHREGQTYFVPAGESEVKEITSYKIWEIAFKVFMGMFNQHWPERMQELLQYSYIIQTAALNHPWENVYNYDLAFREIMTEQPNTHWGVISQQTWSLEIGESSGKNLQGNSAVTVGSINQGRLQKNKNPCWRFNKGKCTFGEKCEFDHRCSHCGKKGHGRHECYKRLRTEKGGEVKREKGGRN